MGGYRVAAATDRVLSDVTTLTGPVECADRQGGGDLGGRVHSERRSHAIETDSRGAREIGTGDHDLEANVPLAGEKLVITGTGVVVTLKSMVLTAMPL